jgi:hypothetical protein
MSEKPISFDIYDKTGQILLPGCEFTPTLYMEIIRNYDTVPASIKMVRFIDYRDDNPGYVAVNYMGFQHRYPPLKSPEPKFSILRSETVKCKDWQVTLETKYDADMIYNNLLAEYYFQE